MTDVWSSRYPSILMDSTLASVRHFLESVCPLIVEHKHYRGASAPTRLVFDDADEFEQYLKAHSVPGDLYRIWRYDECCRADNAIVAAKYPDADGRTPETGPY